MAADGAIEHKNMDLAANRQSILNMRLRKDVVMNAQAICELYTNNWSDQQRKKIAAAHSAGIEILATFEREVQFHLEKLYDLEELMRQGKLDMQQSELDKPTDQPVIVEILNVKKAIQDRKNNHNKGRIVSFTSMLENALAQIDAIEQDLRVSQLDATELAKVPREALEYVERAMNVTSISLALRQTDENLENLEQENVNLRNKIIDCEAGGDMVLAEEYAFRQIALEEARLKEVKEKFKKISDVEAENEAFRHIGDVQRTASASSVAIRDQKRHLKTRCTNDLKIIQEMIQRADITNTEARTAYSNTMEQSNRMLKDNMERQGELWTRLQDHEKSLRKLAQERQEELMRRSDDVMQERRRQVKYAQFLEVVRQHRNLLDITVANCDTMARCSQKMENLVVEACTAIKTRYDALAHELNDLRFEVHKEYLRYFRSLYKNLGTMIHRKERKQRELASALAHANIHLQFCVETFDPAAKKHSIAKHNIAVEYKAVGDQLDELHARQARSHQDFKPTEEALLKMGFEFFDPVADQKEENLKWRQEMVQYRAMLTEHEEVKIAHEREVLRSQGEDLKRQRTIGGASSSLAIQQLAAPP